MLDRQWHDAGAAPLIRSLVNVLLLSFLLVSAGCAHKGGILAEWVGRSADDLTDKWGAPDLVVERYSEGKVYTWIITGKAPISCRISFRINKSGVVEYGSYYGCPRYLTK